MAETKVTHKNFSKGRVIRMTIDKHTSKIKITNYRLPVNIGSFTDVFRCQACLRSGVRTSCTSI